MAERDDAAEPDDGYAVGYGKPPKEHQFKRGQSGNPRGRQKGSRGLKTDLQAELDGTIAITINGERVSGTRQRLFVKALATRAAFGDLKAAAILAPLILQVLGIEDRGGRKQQLSASDQALLDEILSAGEPIADGNSAGEQPDGDCAENDAAGDGDEPGRLDHDPETPMEDGAE